MLKDLQGSSNIVVMIQFNVEEPDLTWLELSLPYRVRRLWGLAELLWAVSHLCWGFPTAWRGLLSGSPSGEQLGVMGNSRKSFSHREVLADRVDFLRIEIRYVRNSPMHKSVYVQPCLHTSGGGSFARMRRRPTWLKCCEGMCVIVFANRLCRRFRDESEHGGSAPLA